jgi:energy-converting hydrogenase Eha subunit F
MKKPKFRCPALFAAVVALSVLTGCNTVSINSNPYVGVPQYPPSNPAQIQILRKEPVQPYVQLGEVRAEPASDSVSVQQIEAALRKAAAKMGANAVVIKYDRTEVTGAMVTGPSYGRSVQQIVGRVIVGVAIRYTESGS